MYSAIDLEITLHGSISNMKNFIFDRKDLSDKEKQYLLLQYAETMHNLNTKFIEYVSEYKQSDKE